MLPTPCAGRAKRWSEAFQHYYYKEKNRDDMIIVEIGGNHENKELVLIYTDKRCRRATSRIQVSLRLGEVMEFSKEYSRVYDEAVCKIARRLYGTQP